MTEIDKISLEEKGISEKQIQEQLHLFQQGTQPITLSEIATIGNGIHQFSEEEAIKYASLYQKKKQEITSINFIPASGAATRMFQELFIFLENFNPEKETFSEYVAKNKVYSLAVFFENMEKFAFFPLFSSFLKKNKISLEALSEDEKKLKIVSLLLGNEGLDFGNLPKGLFPFHLLDGRILTAFEAHFHEAALCTSKNQKVQLHFTILPQHTQAFFNKLSEFLPILEKEYELDFQVSFSYQKGHTDTLAVHLDNSPFRDKDGKLFFRPGGHGSLLENLNEQLADVIFIKNIDNVVTQKHLDKVVFYKEVLAGKLEDVRSKVHQILRKIDFNQAEKEDIELAFSLLENFDFIIPESFQQADLNTQKDFVFKMLHRPIRICGMVKNEGAVGGGPFWVKDENGVNHLQIVEMAQINIQNPQQAEILAQSTHFNPVNLACCIKNYKGDFFNLSDFSDPKQSFISTKKYKGETIKILEHPGLWNGAMADWLTFFVELPSITFNPVKSVNDLLGKFHQE